MSPRSVRPAIGSLADDLFDAEDTLDALESELTDALLTILGVGTWSGYHHDANDRSLEVYGMDGLDLSREHQQAIWELGFSRLRLHSRLEEDLEPGDPRLKRQRLTRSYQRGAFRKAPAVVLPLDPVKVTSSELLRRLDQALAPLDLACLGIRGGDHLVLGRVDAQPGDFSVELGEKTAAVIRSLMQGDAAVAAALAEIKYLAFEEYLR